MIDVQNERKLLSQLAHAGEVLQPDACPESRRFLNVLGIQFDDLVHRVRNYTHHRIFRLLLNFHDDDASSLRGWPIVLTKAYGQIHDGDDVAAKIDDTANPARHPGNLRDGGILDDFLYLLNVDGVLLVRKKERQILLLHDCLLFSDFHGFLGAIRFERTIRHVRRWSWP